MAAMAQEARAQAARQVEFSVAVIRGLEAAMSEYSFVLAAGWTGTAATAVNGLSEAFSADFAEVLNALQVMREQLVPDDLREVNGR